MNIIADSETFLIDIDPDTAALPIVGWALANGVNAIPLVVCHPGPLVSGEAFLLPTGRVYDPHTGMSFDYEGEWREWVTGNDTYRAGSVLPGFGFSTKSESPSAAQPVVTRTPPQPKNPAPAGTIEWGSKTYKSKSFWSFSPPDEDEFIFMVEGDSPVPKNATKITRDEFFARRKAGAVERSGRPDDEPELPLKGPAPAEAEDDDDLI